MGYPFHGGLIIGFKKLPQISIDYPIQYDPLLCDSWENTMDKWVAEWILHTTCACRFKIFQENPCCRNWRMRHRPCYWAKSRTSTFSQMAKVKPDSDSQRTPATHVELYCGSFVDIDKFMLILLNADSSRPETLQKKIVFDDLAFVCYCCKDHMLPVVWFASYSRQRIRTSLPVCVPSIHYDIYWV